MSNILNYINSSRFDLMAKLLYIKYPIQYYKDLYIKHIETFNKLWEYPGTKNGLDDFINQFDTLIKSIKNNGFNNDYPILLSEKNNIIINGSHRLMVCYFLNIIPKFKIICDKKGDIYNYDFFLNRNNYWRRNQELYESLNREYTDRMALEFVIHKKNIRSMTIYPICYSQYMEKNNKLEEIIKKYGYICYKKEIYVNKVGVGNLIKEMYRGEKWIGGLFPNNTGGKLEFCYQDKPIISYLIEFIDVNKADQFKQECRNIFNMGKHSLHIPDNQYETFRIASTIFNNNSIKMLEKNTMNNLNNEEKLILQKIFNNITEYKTDSNNGSFNNSNNINHIENFCIHMKNTLQSNIQGNLKSNFKNENYKNINISYNNCNLSNNVYEIMYNPKYHFYFNGFKFDFTNFD